MENQILQTRKFILTNGVLLGLFSIALSVIFYVMNLHLEKSSLMGILSFLLTVIVIVMGISQFKKANGGFLNLGQAIKIGIGIALISGIIGIAYQLIFMNYIEPDYMDQIMNLQYEKMMEQNPNMTQEQIDMAMEMGKKFSSPWISVAFGIIGSLFFGLIISLISGLVMKKENNHA